MPSPIAHSVTGIAIAQLAPSIYSGTLSRRQAAIQTLVAICIVCIPDIDFLAEFITGQPYHRGLTHSLLFMFAFVVVLTLIVNKVSASFSSRSFFTLALLAYCSHLVLDFLTRGNPGIQLLWPFSEKQFQSPLALFPSARPSAQIIQHPEQILAFVLFELGYGLILLVSVWIWRRKA